MYRSIEPLLKSWKSQKDRLPLILRGARQVGKSFIIEKFGREEFEHLVIANFEYMPELITCFDTLNPNEICSKLEVFLNQKIIPGKTLLFLDEIQNCPKAITALRYFKEKMENLHVIAAGSLLEFALNEEQFSFPVGRVQFLYLKPLSFDEYLINIDRNNLLNFLNRCSLSEPLDSSMHELCMKHLREYFLLGGMPAVIRKFVETSSFKDCEQTLTLLLETYRNDFPKYTSKTEYQYLQLFFEKAPGLITQQFKFSHIDQEVRSASLKRALQQLNWAGLIQTVIGTSASGIPLQAHAKDSLLKLLFLDLGLVNRSLKLDLTSTWSQDLLTINSGALAEQFVGQELLAYADPFAKEQLYFWKREKAGSSAEIDYVMQVDGKIIPIEVKAGATGSLKSLSLFMQEKKSICGIRISQHPLSFHQGILSVPLYMIRQLPRLVNTITG